MNSLFNWKYLTLLVTIVSVVVPVWIWRADLSSRSLQFRIASQVSLQPDNANSIQGLQVSVDGVPLKSPYLSVLELSNDGEKPIPSSDFEAPLEIRIGEDSSVARAQVTATNPKDVEATLTWELQSLKIKPLLLNPKDVVTISILTSGKKPEFTTRARIAGISAVPIDDSAGKPKKLQTVMLFFSALILFAASSITNNGFFAHDPIFLRKRAAILVSTSTGFVGAILFIVFIDIVGITSLWQIILSFIGIILVSILLGVFWNRNPMSASPSEQESAS
jgi:hypothetical protein